MRRRQRGLQFYRKKKGLSMQAVKEVFSWIVLSVLAVFLAFMVIWAVGLRTNMIGVSMEPGLTNGQGILVNRLKYRFFSPQTGDVVVFLPNGNQNAHYYVKRVVAVPGQTVLIQDGILYIDGKAQENEEMDGKMRVIDYVKEVGEYIQTSDGRITASQMLERFLFDPAMQYTPVEKLSGGEKRRLYLLKVLMEAPNVLLLDEPGNDLDIPTMTILEDYLDSFSGIVITVSHDRYFLDNVVNRIMAFEGDGRLVQYEGGYTDYLEAKERKGQSLETRSDMNGGTVQGETAEPEKKKSAADTWKQNRKQKLKFTYKEQKEFDTIDDDIAALEERLEQIDKEMAANATNAGKLRELSDEQQEIQQKLDEKMDRWVYLNDLAEQIENQKE